MQLHSPTSIFFQSFDLRCKAWRRVKRFMKGFELTATCTAGKSVKLHRLTKVCQSFDPSALSQATHTATESHGVQRTTVCAPGDSANMLSKSDVTSVVRPLSAGVVRPVLRWVACGLQFWVPLNLVMFTHGHYVSVGLFRSISWSEISLLYHHSGFCINTMPKEKNNNNIVTRTRQYLIY